MLPHSKPVAIIGTAFRLPGCQSQSFTDALLDQRDLITQVESSRWNLSSYQHPDPKHPGTSYTFAAGSLGNIRGFDAGFFGLSPREVMHMDPQQRLLLEMTWEAMEQAGYAPSTLKGARCGVYMGVSSIDYGLRYHDDIGTMDQNTGTGTTASISANRISYLYDLKGPSLIIDTACSSSMVAFHHACQAIRQGEVPMALAGGISLHLHPFGFLAFAKASMLSRQGRCRVFDASADGYVRSEGGGVLMLKDYQQALADGDNILALVAGTAANADGYKSALTVPNPQAQMNLMREVYQSAGISPDQITYLEAHGTGTPVGDPIEARAIGEALGQARKQPLLIGSVKSNVGHLETASGMAGLAKALTCIERRIIPATIGIQELNPAIPFDTLNLQVVTENCPIPANEPIVIGVNSFGFGGANAHAILTSAPVQAEPQKRQEAADHEVPVWISARSDAALKQRAQDISEQLQRSPKSLYDIAWTLRYRRERHPLGAWIQGANALDISQQLADYAADKVDHQVYSTRFIGDQAAPVFVYSGNGCQWPGMAAALLRESAGFRRTLEQVDSYYRQYTDTSLLTLIAEANDDSYRLTALAQPALFAIQVGLTQLLRDAGIQPAAVVGHSVGEVAAAWASGALTLQQAVEVVWYRSHYQGTTAGSGQMTAVALSAEAMLQQLQDLAIDDVCIAGINSQQGVTLAGSPDSLHRVETQLRQSGVRFKRLDLNYAFHSPAMDSIQADLLAALSSLTPSAATACPFYSTVKGDALSGEALNAEYWWQNIREPVAFYPAIQKLLPTHTVFVEIGAHPVLSGYLKEILKTEAAASLVIPTLNRDQPQQTSLQQTQASLWGSGAALDWKGYFPIEGQLIELPAYPWQREEYWLPQSSESHQFLNAQEVHPLLGKPLAQWSAAWENSLDIQAYPWLAEHQIGQAVLFPGSGFVELALAAAYQQQKRLVLDIEELEIRAPLVLADQPSKKVRTRSCSDQGHLIVESRDLQSEDDYTLHLKCRILSETAGLDLLQDPLLCPQRSPDFSRDDLQRAAQSAGLHYGESFQCIAEGWVEGNQILGRVEPRGHAADHQDAYLIHPGILDSAFQLVMALLYLKGNTEVVYVPVQVGRIQWQASDDPVAQVSVTLKRQLPHSLLMDVSLFDHHGNALAHLQDVRMRAAVLRQHKVHHIDQLIACLTPAPLPASVGTPIQLDTCQTQLQSVLKHAQSYQSYVTEVEPLLDTFAEQIVSLMRAQEVDSAHLQRLIKRAESDDLEPLDIDPASIWYALLHDYPAHFSLAHYLGRLYCQLLSQHSGLSVETFELDLQPAYTGMLRVMLSETAHHQIANLFRDTLKEITESLPSGQRLSVLELSGGEPWWAPWIYEGLDSRVLDYTCVLVSEEAQASQSGLQAKHPQLNCVTADQWQEQALAQAEIDIAWVTLDFADLTLAKVLLKQLQKQLKPGGEALLFMNHPALWMDCALGVQPEWWINDSQTQQASWKQWQELLQHLGFDIAQQLPDQWLKTGLFTLRVKRSEERPVELDASQPCNDSRSGWLILADQPPVALVHHLEAENQPVCVINSWDQLDQALTELGTVDQHQFVLMPSCAGNLQPTERCIQLHQGVMQLGQRPELKQVTLYCITQGVAPMFQPDQPIAYNVLNTGAEGLADSAIWGFVRTLMNEVPQFNWRLIDLPNETLSVSHLISELHAASQETEVVYDTTGARYAVRFRPVDQVNNTQLSDDQTLSLGFTLPGQLRNLAWQAHVQEPPGPEQLLVKVKATGLNFRDVMYALGLLSDEAIENGYSGPTLGLEFAGEVLAVGAGVTDYQPGDAVVGFGPASFSTRLLAHQSAIAPLPPGITYEAAATIPTTFFTAWYALKHLAQLMPGERVLIHGAAGGVGIAAIQIAQILGAEIYATAGSAEKRDFLAMMGVEHIYDSRSHVYAEQILQDTADGQGVDVVLNSLAGEAIAQNLRVLKPFGRFLELGKRDFYENTPMGLRPFRNNISYFGIDSDQLMKVKPALTEKLFKEVMQRFHSGELYPLPYTLFTADRVEEAFRFMQQARQIGKIVVTYPRIPEVKQQAVSQDVTLQLDPQGLYLVTGGLSGFGFRTAQWLVEKGARVLCLISRSGQVSADIAEQIEQWRHEGLQIEIRACDVVDYETLAQTLQQLADIAPIKGVVHAAAVYDDALVAQLSDEQIRRVMSVKVQGAYNLHQLTESLELFVLFSSATTLFGNPGQSHYVAANHWLEALAAWRRQAGLAATCVNWGPINDVGYLARQTQVKEHLQGRLGSDALQSDDALLLMERFIVENRSGVHALYLDWSALSRFLPSAEHPKYQLLNRLSKDQGQAGDQQAELQRMLALGEIAEAEQLLIQLLTTELSNILLLPEQRIDPNQPIYDMGFDSLMAAELMAAIDSRLGVQLPVMALNDTLTLTRLAALLMDKLNAGHETVDTSPDTALTQAALREKHGAGETA